ELIRKLDRLHAADVAYLLEALPRDERLYIWNLVRASRDGEILLEVSEPVRESLIRLMDTEDLVASPEALAAEEIAELAPDSDPDTLVEKVMQPPTVKLLQHEKADVASSAFERYGLISAPVVDTNDRLVGRVTVDEVLDFVRQRGEEERLAQGGLREEEDVFASVWTAFQNRWAWLA